MIRTTLSVLILFGSLLLLGLLLAESKAESAESAAAVDPTEQLAAVRPHLPLRQRLRGVDFVAPEPSATSPTSHSTASVREPAAAPAARIARAQQMPKPLRDPAYVRAIDDYATHASGDQAQAGGEQPAGDYEPPTRIDEATRAEAYLMFQNSLRDFENLRRNLTDTETGTPEETSEAKPETTANTSSSSISDSNESESPSATPESDADAESNAAKTESPSAEPAELNETITTEITAEAELPGFVEISVVDDGQPEANSGTDVVEVDPDEPPALGEEPDTSEFQPLEPSASDEKQQQATPPNKTAPPVVVEPRVMLSPEMLELRERVRDALAQQFANPESANERSPWGIMHGMIAFGVDSEILTGNRRVNAASWLCWNGSCRGMKLMYTRRGQIEVRQGPGYQGHQGQLLAILAQCRVPVDYPMQVDGKHFTIADLVEYEKGNCQAKTELTFNLIGLSHYLDTDAIWQNSRGQHWNMERLIHEELSQPIVGAACGGTHRMMGFSYSLRKRTDAGKPVVGQWARAKEFVDDYHAYTLSLQNPDGSFSTEWFERRAAEPSIERRLQTTGHILEWMVFSLPKEELTSPRIVAAVEYLTNLMLENPRQKWEVGPRGHAIRALALYDERVFGGEYGEREKQLAERAAKLRLR
ncbi:MAG: hypothetical protein KDA38_02340 [Planctomycetales bacterium]|nr:hypothetical protein [Planctomycetales bacterium]